MDDIRRLIVVSSPNSTRAHRLAGIARQLNFIAESYDWTVVAIQLDGIPYFEAVRNIGSQLADGDLVIAAGGDGVAQATFDACYRSNSDVVYATIPLGNGNDISRALNGRNKSVPAIFDQEPVDYYPLNVVVDRKTTMAIASYITFGATTIVVDHLNSQSCRRTRKWLRFLSPAMSMSMRRVNSLSKDIDNLEFPDFKRGSRLMRDDSLGFFVIPAAKGALRLPKDVRLASSEFYFHHASTKGKGLGRKILMAGAWAFKFPGTMTELEEIEFVDNKTAIQANISGDNVDLGTVKTISAIRSTRPVKVLFNKN